MPTSGSIGSESSVIDAIAGGCAVEPLARYFEFWLLRLQGVYPSCRRARLRRRFDGGARDAAARAITFLCRRVRARGGGTALSVDGAAVPGAARRTRRPSAGRSSAGRRRRSRELETVHRPADEPAPGEGAEIRAGAARDAAGPVTARVRLLRATSRFEWSRCNSSSSNCRSSGRPAAASSSSRSTSRWAPGRCTPRRSCACSARSLERRLRAAVAAPGRRPLRREPEPPVQAPPVPGHPQAGARRSAAAVSAEPRGLRHRPARARRALRGGQLGVAHARRVGHRLAGAVRRPGDHAVHLLPAGRRDRPLADLGGADLRARAVRDGAAGRRQRVRPGVGRRA